MQYDDVCISMLLGKCFHNTEAKMSPEGDERNAGSHNNRQLQVIWLFSCFTALTAALDHYAKVKGAFITASHSEYRSSMDAMW